MIKSHYDFSNINILYLGQIHNSVKVFAFLCTMKGTLYANMVQHCNYISTVVCYKTRILFKDCEKQQNIHLYVTGLRKSHPDFSSMLYRKTQTRNQNRELF